MSAADLRPCGFPWLFGGLGISTVLLQPVVEEWALRGSLQPALRQRFPEWQAIAIAAAPVILFHHISEWPAFLSLGMICGWVATRSRSLAMPILIHVLASALLFIT